MLFSLFRWLVFVTLLTGLALWMAHNPGSVTIQWAHWRLDTTASVFTAIVVLSALLGLWLFQLVRGLFSLPTLTKKWMHQRKLKEGFQALGRAYAANLIEDIDTFQKEALRAKKLLQDEPVALLAAAQATLAAGRSTVARPLLSTLSGTTYARSPALKLLADVAEKEGDYVEQKRLAQEAYSLAPRSAWVIPVLMTCYIRDKDWGEAAQKAEEFLKFMPHDPLCMRIASACWAACAEHDLESDDPTTAVRHARKALRIKSDFLPALVIAIRSFQRDGSVDKASSLIAETWPKKPHPVLADCFFDLHAADDSLKVASKVQKITHTASEAPESFLFLAEAALKAHLWGQARTALSPLCDQNNAKAAYLMAQVEDGDRGSAEVVSMWLQRAVEWRKANLTEETDEAYSAQAWLMKHYIPNSPNHPQRDVFLPLHQSPRPVLMDLTKKSPVI